MGTKSKNTKHGNGKGKQWTENGKNVRFPPDLLEWLQRHTKDRGISSEAELIRQIVHEYRRRLERGKTAAA
jgi:hypothetical protein